MNLSYTVNTLLNFYFIIIILRCFLTWIPNLDWFSQPLKTIAAITDPFLNLFRRIIPSVGGLDFSPIVALIVLQIIQQGLVIALRTAGL